MSQKVTPGNPTLGSGNLSNLSTQDFLASCFLRGSLARRGYWGYQVTGQELPRMKEDLR